MILPKLLAVHSPECHPEKIWDSPGFSLDLTWKRKKVGRCYPDRTRERNHSAVRSIPSLLASVRDHFSHHCAVAVHPTNKCAAFLRRSRRGIPERA